MYEGIQIEPEKKTLTMESFRDGTSEKILMTPRADGDENS